MRQLRGWSLRLAGMFNRRQRDCELSAEMESHLQMHMEENIRAGMSPLEARRLALIQLGGVESVKESYRRRCGLPLLETLGQDLRYALRMLRRRPRFAALAVATLCLCLCPNTPIFALVRWL